MKKVLSILFIGLITIILVPFNVNAKSISTLNVENNSNKLTVSGTTENGVLAVAVLVYSKDDLTHIQTCSNNNTEYSCELSKTFEKGNYTVKVADYNGGNYIAKNISIGTLEANPKTLDNIIMFVSLGLISLIGITICTILIKKKKKLS